MVDGGHGDVVRYGAFERGAWRMELPLPWNAPAGEYAVTVTDLAGGLSREIRWTLPAEPTP